MIYILRQAKESNLDNNAVSVLTVFLYGSVETRASLLALVPCSNVEEFIAVLTRHKKSNCIEDLISKLAAENPSCIESQDYISIAVRNDMAEARLSYQHRIGPDWDARKGELEQAYLSRLPQTTRDIIKFNTLQLDKVAEAGHVSTMDC